MPSAAPAVLQIGFPIASFESFKAEGAAETLKVFGKGSVAVGPDGTLIKDHHQDHIEPWELEAAAYAFVKQRGDLDADHDGEKRGELIESVYLSPEKCKAMGVQGSAECSWFVGFEVTDSETIRRVKSGELKELSIEYSAMRHTFEDDQQKSVAGVKGAKALADREVGRLRQLKLHRLSLVDAGAGKGVQVTLWKRREERARKSMDELMKQIGMLPEEEQKAILSALSSKFGGKEPPVPPKEDPKPDDAPKALETDGEKALKAKLAKLEAQLATETKARELRDATEEAKALRLEYLPGSLEEHAEDILEIRRTKSKDAADARIARMKSAAEAIKKGELLKSAGAGPRGPTVLPGGGNSDAAAKIDVIAREMVSKDSALSIHKAKALAWQQHPELVRQATTERKGA